MRINCSRGRGRASSRRAAPHLSAATRWLVIHVVLFTSVSYRYPRFHRPFARLANEKKREIIIAASHVGAWWSSREVRARACRLYFCRNHDDRCVDVLCVVALRRDVPKQINKIQSRSTLHVRFVIWDLPAEHNPQAHRTYHIHALSARWFKRCKGIFFQRNVYLQRDT